MSLGECITYHDTWNCLVEFSQKYNERLYPNSGVGRSTSQGP